MSSNFHQKKESGQVLLLTVIVLSAAMVTASIVGGNLIASQLRESKGVSDSARALYAADAGLEYELYRTFIAGGETYPAIGQPLSNGADFQTSVTAGRIKSLGHADKKYRAFEVTY